MLKLSKRSMQDVCEFLAFVGAVKSWNFPRCSCAAWRHSCHH